MSSPWDQFDQLGKYRIVDSGRPAIFLIPAKKLGYPVAGGMVVQGDLEQFLLKNFGGFTTTRIPSFGIWRDDGGKVVQDECIQYEVSFEGKENIPILLEKLAEVLVLIGEDCLYVKAGQYAMLLYPPDAE